MLLPASLAAALATGALGAQWAPGMRLDVAGGPQTLVGGRSSPVGGADWLASPAVRIGGGGLLIPAFSGSYRGRQEGDAYWAGLFRPRESLSQTVLIKSIQRLPGEWSARPVLSYRAEWIAEQSEALGSGRLDSGRLGGGLEIERRGQRLKSLRQAVGVSRTQFQRLEILDHDSLDAALLAEVPLGESASATGSARGALRSYRRQRVVGPGGLLSGSDRRDVHAALSAAVSRSIGLQAGAAVLRTAGFTLGAAWLDSNQSAYDGAAGRFLPDYFDYAEISGGPSVSASWGRTALSAGYALRRRTYSRPARSANGAWLEPPARWLTQTMDLSARAPLQAQVEIVVRAMLVVSGSNVTYVGPFRYNYRGFELSVGLGYSL